MMNKKDVRIQLVNPLEPFDTDLIYISMMGAKGPALGILQVLDEETQQWWSVELVATESKRIVS